MKKPRRQKTLRTAEKKNSSRSAKSRKGVPRTANELYAMPKSAQDDWSRTLEGVALMKSGHSARRAAQIVGLPYRKFLRLARMTLAKRPNGRYRAKRVDRLLRVLGLLTRGGIREIAVRDSLEATKLAKYWDAVHRFVANGDATRLRQFRGKHIIDTNGVRHPLLTDLAEIDRLANAGVLSFESLYRRR